MFNLHLSSPNPFRFKDVVFAHGWLRLLPFQWCEDTGTLSRIESLPSGRLAQLRLREVSSGVLLETDADAVDLPEVERRARWMLALDEDFAEFHALCRHEPGLLAAAEHGQGRILRSPTVWEDVVKTLFSVNTTWRQTISMTRNLVLRYGQPLANRGHAFPFPEAIADADPEELRHVCRVGYRAAPLVRIARAVTTGEVDLEALKQASADEAELRLRALPGIGPYAAANVLMLLGHYDHLPVDSWFRNTVRDAWFEGRNVPDRELIAAFDRFRPYRTLVYRFYDWNGALRTDVWTRTEPSPNPP